MSIYDCILEFMNNLIQEIQSTLVDIVGNAVESVPALLAALIILALTRYGAQLAKKLARSFAEQVISNRSLQTLMVQVATIAAWITGILLALLFAFPDLELGDIIGLLGLGSVAIGFAFQDIFKNFLAGILMLLQQPFKIGDQIEIDGNEGTVQNISLRATEILTYQGEKILIPNSIVFTSNLQVQTALPQRRTDLDIGVDYNTPLPMAVETLLEAAKQVDGVQSSPPVEVDITGFGDSA
ncbi:MAG: mechanosensitive ion channel family protein, partial [Cyanobacteria bacterium P01_H01_bin.119]